MKRSLVEQTEEISPFELHVFLWIVGICVMIIAVVFCCFVCSHSRRRGLHNRIISLRRHEPAEAYSPSLDDMQPLQFMDPNLSFLTGGKLLNFELGNTFRKRHHQSSALHTVRYDFKPASVDQSQDGYIEVGDNNEVTITVPHQQGSKSANTVYKGSKKPLVKECVLIYDPQDGSLVLEKVTSQIQVKKTRLTADNAKMPSVLPSTKLQIPKMAQVKKSTVAKPRNKPQTDARNADKTMERKIQEQEVLEPPPVAPRAPELTEPTYVADEQPNTLSSSDDDSSSSGSSSSDDDSSSSSDGDDNTKSNDLRRSQLDDDLHLSDSESDSD